MLPKKSLLPLLALLLLTNPIRAEKYDPGASDAEIKIGNFTPETGSLADYSTVAHAEAAYFQMVNDQGGINGKIIFLSRDNGSSVQQSVDVTHKLVEEDHVLLMFGSNGGAANIAVREYLNDKKIPQLFVGSPLSAFNDPQHFPWTMGFQASAKTEAAIYAKYILQNRPAAKIAVLYADDDTGKDYLAGLHAGLGDKASQIVKELSYSDKDSSLDAQVTELKNTGADVFVNLAGGKFATQSIRKAHDLGWHPLEFIPNTSISVTAFIDPAGPEKAAGIISSAQAKGWQSAEAQRDPKVQEFLQWMKKYNPKATTREAMYVYGYNAAQTMTEVLKKCGDDLTRANVLKQATALDLDISMILPQIKVKNSPTDYQPIKQLYLMKFDGKYWVRFGDATAMENPR